MTAQRISAPLKALKRFSYFKDSVGTCAVMVGPQDYGNDFGLMVQLGKHIFYWTWWSHK